MHKWITIVLLILTVSVKGQEKPGIYIGEASWRKVTNTMAPEPLPVVSKTVPATKLSANDNPLTLSKVPIDPETITIHLGPTLPVVQTVTFTGKKLPTPKVIPAPALLTRDNAKYNISYTDKKHGFASSYALDFIEDDEHNIWIGSEKGLIKYDGYHYYLYEQALVFPDMPEMSMLYDDQKRIWWVSESGAYYCKNDSIFSIKSSEIDFSTIQCKRVTKDKFNRIWVSTKKNGALCIEGNSVKIYDKRCGLPGNYIETTFPDKKGNIYLGCRDYGIVLLELDKMRMFFSKTKKMSHHIFVSFYEDEDGIWAGSFLAGMMRLGAKDTLQYSINGKFKEAIYDIKKAPNGIWISCYSQGVFYYDKKTLLSFNEKNGLLNNVPYLIFEDSFHNLWVSNVSGFSRINDNRLYLKGYDNPLIKNVKSIIPDTLKGGNWITTYGSNLIFQKGNQSTVYTYRNSKGIETFNYPIDAVLNKDGSLWMGSYGEGIILAKEKSFTDFKYSNFTDNGIIISIQKDAAGAVWFCPTKFGLIKYDQEKFWLYTDKSGLLSNDVTNLFSDRQQNMYWSLAKGFQRKKGNDIETFYIGDFAFNDQVNCMLDIDKETFLIGTSHTGLLLIKNNRVYHLTPNHETASKNIHSVIVDTKQTFWITTENSIESFQLQGTNISDHHIYNESFGSYILDAGNVNLDKDGNPYWSNGEYKVVYDPVFATSSVKKPLISFNDILIDSEKLLDNDQISVLPDQRIEINYKTIYWGRENNLQLTYLLISNPGDTTERSVQNNGNIILTDILPGNYRVLLKATDTNDIYYSSAVNITVREFWYNTWTFRIVMGVMIISGIILYFREKAKRQLRVNDFLALKVKEQTQEIEKEKEALVKSYQTIDQQNSEKDVLIDEINHRVKNNLQFISAILELQLNNQFSPDVIQALLGTSRRIKAMSLVHELLYLKKEEIGLSMKEYIHELVENLKEMAVEYTKSVRIELDLEDYLMDSKTALPLGMIISELVSNSFKHAFNQIKDPVIRVKFKFDNQSGMFNLIVSDNGNGYSMNKNVSTGLGRSLVDIFCRQLDGQFTIVTEGYFSYEIQFKIMEV